MIDLSQFTVQQKDVITAPRELSMQIVAGAGSGKTQTLAARICHLFEAGNIDPFCVWAISFTNAASRELKDRITDLAGKNINVRCSTLHSMCYVFLKDIAGHFHQLDGVPRRINIITPDQTTSLISKIRLNASSKFKEYDEKEIGQCPPASEIKRMVSVIKHHNHRLEDSSVMSKFGINGACFYVMQEYDEWCRDHDLFDFDDLISRLVELLELHPSILKRIQGMVSCMFIDEYQDISKDQAHLIDLIIANRPLCVVGDDAQAIYGWRGADVEEFIKFSERANVVVKHLTFNFRSHNGILSITNMLKRHFVKGISPQLRTVSSYIEPRKLIYTHESKEAELIAKQIKATLDTGLYSPNDLVILYRANLRGQDFENALLRHGVKSHIHGRQAFWKKHTVRLVMAMLGLASNPNDFASFSMIAENIDGIGEKTIAKLMNQSEMGFVEALLKLNPSSGLVLAMSLDALRSEGNSTLIGMLDLLFANPKMVIESYEDSDLDTIASIKGLVENQKLQSLDELKEWISFSNEAEDGTGVNLMTMHSAKGKQYKVVFVAGVSQGILPRSGISNMEFRAESRLLYVAMTRAKELLYISHQEGRISSLLEPFEQGFKDWSQSVQGDVFSPTYLEQNKEDVAFMLSLPKSRKDWVTDQQYL